MPESVHRAPSALFGVSDILLILSFSTCNGLWCFGGSLSVAIFNLVRSSQLGRAPDWLNCLRWALQRFCGRIGLCCSNLHKSQAFIYSEAHIPKEL